MIDPHCCAILIMGKFNSFLIFVLVENKNMFMKFEWDEEKDQINRENYDQDLYN